MFLVILLTLKVVLFINLTGIEHNHFLVFIISTLYILLFFTLIYLNKNRRKHILAFSFYSIVSIFMFLDSLYYHYFNGLPSVSMFKQIKQAGVVSDSVTDAIGFLNTLFLIDLPILIIFYISKKKLFKKERKRYDKKWKIGIPSTLLLVLIILNIVLNRLGYATVLAKQEFFTYHGKDVISLFDDREERLSEEKILTKEDIEYLRERVTKENGKYEGIGKDKNLIVLQVESIQNFVINREYDGQEITPNLNNLIDGEGSIYFDRYFQLLGVGNTSDAEFVTNNSLYPSMKNPTYEQYSDNTFYGLPWILRNEGYKSWVFHGYKPEFWNREKAYPNQGFERFLSGDDYELINGGIGFGIADEHFFEQSIDYIKEMGEPFHSFMITLTSHTPFNMPDIHEKIKLRKEHEDTMFGRYLQSIHYTDGAIGKFIEELKEENLYDNTIIAIYGDHVGLPPTIDENKKNVEEYLKKPYGFDEILNIPLIIHIPGEDIKETVSTVGSQIDFLPTILNIMGIKNEKGIMFGVDMLNSTEGIVAQQTQMLKGSFIDQEKIFIMSKDGMFDNSKAKDLKTKKVVEIEKCRETYENVIKEIDKSDFVLKNNFIKNLLEKNIN